VDTQFVSLGRKSLPSLVVKLSKSTLLQANNHSPALGCEAMKSQCVRFCLDSGIYCVQSDAFVSFL